MTVGRIELETGEEMIENGEVDFVAMHRPLMTDAELPNKVSSGRTAQIRPCTRCGTCLDEARERHRRCRMNPHLGEKKYEMDPADTKKKELVGDFKNKGRTWRPKGKPEPVRIHDFIDKELGKEVPSGVYDIAANNGWISIGVTYDTAEFAVASIQRWWKRMGRRRYPKAKELMITADAGGSNGYRARLWKVALQRLADKTGLQIRVCHFPPGTSKWNKIEHRMFSFITKNWEGTPLLSRQAVVELIGSTRTKTGLAIKAALDTKTYAKGVDVSDEEMAALNIHRARFHGDWNYTIKPRR
jgi:hypothetical protein